jgi:hypothetical protein
VYSEWIDACEAVATNKGGERVPGVAAEDADERDLSDVDENEFA